MSNEQWYASRYEDEHWDVGPHKTREDAIADAPCELNLEPGDTFWTGKAAPPEIVMPSTTIFIENVAEYTTENMGDFAEDWLADVTNEQEKDLATDLRACFESWLDKHNLRPTFFTIKNTQEHTAPTSQETAT